MPGMPRPLLVFRASEGDQAASSGRIDHGYLRDREKAERAAAEKASCSNAKRIHQELADAYRDLCSPLAE